MKNDAAIFNFVRATLTLFKAAPNLENEKFPPYELHNELNLAHGFFITDRAFKFCPCIADENILQFAEKNFGYNIFELNRGFYKSFGAVANLTPQQILINKLLHYFSTYGAEDLGIFDREFVYIPPAELELPAESKPLKITVIGALDNAEIAARTVNLIQSGAALSDETLDALAVVVTFLEIDLDVDEIKNKEFAMRLCQKLNILPKNPVQFLRYLIYVGTGSTLLIKSAETCRALSNSAADFDYLFVRYIETHGLAKLAAIFNRFKPLWLTFKFHSPFLKSTINRMSKLAKKYHKPAAPPFLERLTSAENFSLEQLQHELAQVSTYRKISLANCLLYRNAAPESIIYRIRNGKIFVDEYSAKLKFDATKILDVILNSIVEDIQPNVRGKKIYIPANFSYATPVSEKNFVGNFPDGSCYTFADNSVVLGVHWFNLRENDKEVRVDLDLHLNSNKIDIGWQNDFDAENFINTRKRKIIFSGDMTDAPIATGGATEAFFVSESFGEDILTVKLNHFNQYAENPVPFKLFLGGVNLETIDRNFLIDAHEISFCVPCEISCGEMLIGYLACSEDGGKKFYFSAGKLGDRRVARSDSLTAQALSAMSTNFKSCLSLREILSRAGAIFENVTAENCDINLDPAEISKDTLLALFAK